METKNVVLNGVTNEPNDYKHQDGDLSLCVNAVKHNGSIRTIGNGEVVGGVTINSGEKLIYIHNVNGTDHYIFCKETADSTDPTGVSSSGNKYTIKSPVNQVTSVGNTLVVTTSSGLGYYIWVDNAYKYLGDSIPDLPIHFGLQGSIEYKLDISKVVCSKAQANEDYEEKLDIQKSSSSFDEEGRVQLDLTLFNELQGAVKITNLSSSTVHFARYLGGDYIRRTMLPGESVVEDHTYFLKTYIYEKINFHIESVNGTYPNMHLKVYTATINSVVVSDTKENFDAVYGAIDKYIGDYSKEGKFVLPFFVRSAVELYDGSVINHSPVCFMLPSTGQSPVIFMTKNLEEGKKATVNVIGVPCNITYEVDSSSLNNLKQFSDVVKGITIAVSRPFYTYKDYSNLTESQRLLRYDSFLAKTGLTSGYLDGLYTYSKVTNSTSDSNSYKKQSIYRLICESDIASDIGTDYQRIILPEWSNEDYAGKIRDFEGLYRIADISLNDIRSTNNNEYSVLDTTNTDVSIVNTYPYLDDDYNTRNKLYPSVLFNYNNRLNIADIKETIWNGSGLNSCNCLDTTDTSFNTKVLVKITSNGNSYEVVSDLETNASGGNYFFYPDNNAKSATIYRKNYRGKWSKTDIKLTECTNINGSYWYRNNNPIKYSEIEIDNDRVPSSGSTIVHYPNKIYTSEVGNPFLFKAEMRNVVGNTKIIGISTTTTALSQGQFGQFPLYCFTNDGIWALETKDDGGWKSVQPVSRDVCISPSSITQTDGSVLFVTKRGLMELYGEKTTLISEMLDGHNYISDKTGTNYNIAKLDQALTLASLANFGLPSEHISDYLCGCSILYDYKHQLLYVFKDNNQLGYVYDMTSKSWGMYNNKLKYCVNSYEKALAVATVGSDLKLIDMSEDNSSFESATNNMILITRPLVLDYDDIHKTIESLIVRGMFDGGKTGTEGQVKVIIWASNNLRDWVVIGSSNNEKWRNYSGTPYKYFRVGVLGSMQERDSINSISVQFTPRLTNKIR